MGFFYFYLFFILVLRRLLNFSHYVILLKHLLSKILFNLFYINFFIYIYIYIYEWLKIHKRYHTKKNKEKLLKEKNKRSDNMVVHNIILKRGKTFNNDQNIQVFYCYCLLHKHTSITCKIYAFKDYRIHFLLHFKQL